MIIKFINKINYFFILILARIYSIFYFVCTFYLYKKIYPSSFISPLSTIKNKNNVHIENNVIIKSFSSVSGMNFLFKKGAYIGYSCHFFGDVEIHEDVIVAPNCIFAAGDHYFSDKSTAIKFQGGNVGKIIIKKNTWIGANVSILKNVSIGQGSVIGAGSVVTKSVPDFSIVVGNPAKVIKKIL